MKTAAKVFAERHNQSKLSTGSGDLDALIDGIAQGQSYLLYSKNQGVLDVFVHRVIVNCILPSEKGGFASKAIYFNTCNYHRGKTILNPSYLAVLAKCAGVDPKVVFENTYLVSVFNEVQQLAATKEVADLMEKDKDVKLIVVHNLSRFIETSSKLSTARRILKQVVGSLKRIASENNIALVVSCNASGSSRGRIPVPAGWNSVRQETNVVLLFTDLKGTATPSVKVTLVKHPHKKTPQSICLYVPVEGTSLTGRMTPGFKQQFQNLIEGLKSSNGFQNELTILEHKRAFDLLLKEAWAVENVALSNSATPYMLDILNLMANVYNKKHVEELRIKLQELERTLTDGAGEKNLPPITRTFLNRVQTSNLDTYM